LDNRLNVFQKWVILDFFWHGLPAARLSAERACRIGAEGMRQVILLAGSWFCFRGVDPVSRRLTLVSAKLTLFPRKLILFL
jgi:hypothetical protein